MSVTTLPAHAQAGRIYTKADLSELAGITGKVSIPLSHAMAVERDRVRMFLADLADGGKTFSFGHLPVGKYDLVLVSKTGTIYEGLALGDKLSGLSAPLAANLEKRIKMADAFFNQYTVHRAGVTGLDTDGDAVVLAFVERLRGADILKQSGEKLDQMLRRLEIIELHQATDDWQMIGTRHLYREGEPIVTNPQFFKHTEVPELGSIRVVDSVKDLGAIALPEK